MKETERWVVSGRHDSYSEASKCVSSHVRLLSQRIELHNAPLCGVKQQHAYIQLSNKSELEYKRKEKATIQRHSLSSLLWFQIGVKRQQHKSCDKLCYLCSK